MSDKTNDMLVLINGESGSGKSASLRNLRDPERVLYMNCESGKRLPFRNSFTKEIITDPYEVHDLMDQVVANPQAVSAAVIDTVTFMMNMYESRHVLTSNNTQKAWGDYFQFWQDLMQQRVSQAQTPVLMLAHTSSELNEELGAYQVAVPVKGALKRVGVESFFSTVVATKKMRLKDLVPYENDLLTITEEDEAVGFKHVFQTRLTKSTTGERIRSPLGLFDMKQTFIDNDAQLLLDHMFAYYHG